MVEAVNKVSLRGQRRRDRMQKLKEAHPQVGVRVLPTDEKFRKLKHPNGMAFRSEGSIEWPNDRFTKRRIAEGAVKLEEHHEDEQHRRDEDRQHEGKQHRDRHRDRDHQADQAPARKPPPEPSETAS